MLDERKISLCLTSYNRVNLLLESFEKVYADDRISEIVVSDDCSEPHIYNKLESLFIHLPKVKLYRNEVNLDCYANKNRALELASNDNCISLDSDNNINADYLNKIYNIPVWEENAAYLPSWASPHFDYRKYEGKTITSANVREYMHDPTFTTMLNTHNHFVNKNFYNKVWDATTNPHTSDSIYMNYLWLKNGGKLYVVPGLTYEHRVDDHGDEQHGHYGMNHMKTGNFHRETEQKLKELI